MGFKYGDQLASVLRTMLPGVPPPPELGDLTRDLNQLWDNEQVLESWMQVGQSKIASAAIAFPFAPIYSEILAVDTATLTIQVPGVYKHLLIFGSGRCTKAGGSSSTILCAFNGDTGNNYVYNLISAVNGVAGGLAGTIGGAPLGILADDGQTAGFVGSFYAFIPGYTSNLHKSAHYFLRVGGVNEATNYGACFWRNTSPIQSLTIVPSSDSIKAGTTLSIYGLL